MTFDELKMNQAVEVFMCCSMVAISSSTTTGEWLPATVTKLVGGRLVKLELNRGGEGSLVHLDIMSKFDRWRIREPKT